MSCGRILCWMGLTLSVAAVSLAGGQSVSRLPSEGLQAAPQGATPSGEADQATQEIVREIEDWHFGDRWVLPRNIDHPAGPGRLVLISVARVERSSRVYKSTQFVREREYGTASLLPIIRAGDRVIVEDHTKIADARLEAVALGAAAAGSALTVRLKIGGRSVRVIAEAPGQALLPPTREGMR